MALHPPNPSRGPRIIAQHGHDFGVLGVHALAMRPQTFRPRVPVLAPLLGAGHTIPRVVDVPVVLGAVTAIGELTNTTLEFAFEGFGFLVLRANVRGETGFSRKGGDFGGAVRVGAEEGTGARVGFEVVVELRFGDKGVWAVLAGELFVACMAAEVDFEFDAVAEGRFFRVGAAAAPAVVPPAYYTACVVAGFATGCVGFEDVIAEFFGRGEWLAANVAIEGPTADVLVGGFVVGDVTIDTFAFLARGQGSPSGGFVGEAGEGVVVGEDVAAAVVDARGSRVELRRHAVGLCC